MAKKVRLSTYHLPLASVPRGRYELANPELAFIESKKAITRAINRARGFNIPISEDRVHSEGAALKKGVYAFAEKLGVSDELLDSIRDMSAENLIRLYDENEILFESYFDYGGIEDKSGLGMELPENVWEAKVSQVVHFVEQYERRYRP